MPTFCLISSLLLFFLSTAAAFSVGVGIGGGATTSGGRAGGVWIGGGVNTPYLPPQQSQQQPSSPPNPSLTRAYTALQAWKSAITDDPNGVLATWVGPNVCNYIGVFCSSLQESYGGGYSADFSSVQAIDLNQANLKGVLVKELSLITELSLLHLNRNRFSGTIPDTFQDMQYLTELDLSNNQFSGTFPTVTLYMPNLLYLDLRFNNFYASIPEDLFSRQLDAIFINNNQFSGQLPQNLGNSGASVINLSNKFSGPIPASFAYVNTALKEILFLNNQLTGCIPDGLGLFSDITVLDVSYNSLMGHLPDSLSCLEDIEVLNLAHNKLSGELSDFVCSLRNLLNLSVEYNFFSGFSQKCTNLFFRSVGFDFSLNCIPGRGMQRPPPECGVVPSVKDNCLRIPSTKPLICGSLLNLVLGLGNGNVPQKP